MHAPFCCLFIMKNIGATDFFLLLLFKAQTNSRNSMFQPLIFLLLLVSDFVFVFLAFQCRVLAKVHIFWSNQLLNLFPFWPLVGSWRRRSLPLRPTGNYWIGGTLMDQHEVSEY